MPAVPVPADNPITPAKVLLGRRLFFDARLSLDGTIACASCHRQEAAFSDAGRAVSLGVGGEIGIRNAPSIVNAAYRTSLFWDGRAASLEEQALGAFLGKVEMAADTMAVLGLLRSPAYAADWKAAFGDTTTTIWRAMQAIATFERTVVSASSPYDRFVHGDTTALTASQRRGFRLFFSERTMCGHCHGGPDLTDDGFYNIGLFHHYFDLGRMRVTRQMADEARFRTPSLRNVEYTAPYMASGDSEDGEMWTLEQVVDHYNNGGTGFPTKDDRVRKLHLTDQEKADLVAFMKALSDPAVLVDPRFSQP